MELQEKIDDFNQAIDYIEKVLEENHYLDINIDLPEDVVNKILLVLEDSIARNCVIMDALNRFRPAYKLLKEFVTSDIEVSETAMSNALCLYIITMIRADNMFTFYDKIAQESSLKYPSNMLLKTLSDYSHTGDIDDILLGLYTASQQYKKNTG